MINNDTNSKKRMKIEKKTLVRFFALALPLVSAIVVATLPFQAANAQITPAQQQALKSLVATGFTNHFPLKVGSQNFSVPYSINLGQVITITANQPKSILDVILSPTQHQSAPGVFTIQIARHLLDSKNPSGADTPFRLTLDGHGLSWQQISANNTDRTLGIYFTSQNGYLEIFGNQGAATQP